MTKTLLEDQRTLWLIAGLTVLLFAVANLPWQLDDYDQAKQAFTSFQMIKEGRWFYQQTPHEHVATKPPLVGWISAGLFAITRSWDTAWRLPSFLAAIAIAMLLFRAATSAYGTIPGLIALGAFGLNLLSPRLATLVRTDMPLALAIFLIGLVIWQKIRSETEWGLRDQVYIFALLTVAMLIKGPIVYAFLLPGIALFEWRGRVSALRRPDATARRPYQSAWPGWWPWIASVAVFLFWVIGGILFTPGFFDQVVMREFVARFGETIHRPQSLYFYLPHLLHKFAPWSVLIMGIAVFDLASRRWRIGAAFREMSPGTFWLLCWSLGGLIAMSLIPSKRVDRTFPIVPPLCLVLAAQIAKRNSCRHGFVSRSLESVDFNSTGYRPVAVEKQPTRIYRWIAAALLFAIIFTGGYTISKVFSGYRDHRNALAVFGRSVRHEAEVRDWRYEVISAKDEGLLLYVRRTHFIEPDRAVIEWNGGNLDALVASTEKAPALLGELRDASLSSLKSNERKKEEGRDYVLITR
jgi:4-amino-4-deoxy-L-arabinose transferase-like glycosyltransferase